MRTPRTPVLLRLTKVQRAQIYAASGKDVATIRIEPLGAGSGWLYAPGSVREAWLLKRPNPLSYRSAKRKHRPRIDPRHCRFQLVCRPSDIEGVGVFAAESIPARRKVIEYTGERVNPVEAYRRTKGEVRSYIFTVDKFWNIDGVVGGSGAEFINHSCEPNLESRVVAGRVLYHSIRPIALGEELTVDYRFPPSSPKQPCRCGSSGCRGTINLAE